MKPAKPQRVLSGLEARIERVVWDKFLEAVEAIPSPPELMPLAPPPPKPPRAPKPAAAKPQGVKVPYAAIQAANGETPTGLQPQQSSRKGVGGRGHAKDPSVRIRRNVDPPPIVVTADGQLHGPELPDVYKWPEMTLQWWRAWRGSPQAMVFTDTDWQFLIDTAVLHAHFWRGDRSVAGELRQRLSKFGATPEDRARINLRVSTTPPAGAVPVAASPSMQDRRARLLRAVGDDTT